MKKTTNFDIVIVSIGYDYTTKEPVIYIHSKNWLGSKIRELTATERGNFLTEIENLANQYLVNKGKPSTNNQTTNIINR